MNISELSVIGFGAWAVGGAYRYGWGPADDCESIRAIQSAIDCGINWIDTAPVYGYGHSERVIGVALKGLRERPFIATKCGLKWSRDDTLSRVLTPESIFSEVDASLMRLGVDHIDLLQTHWPDVNTPVQETWEAMAECVKKGKVRYIGACNCDVPSLEVMLKIHPVASVQMPYNLLRREIEVDILPYCARRSIPVLAYSPMQSGLLTGCFERGKLAPDDWRLRKDQWFSQESVARFANAIDWLRRYAGSRCMSVGQLAIAWAMSHPAVKAAIVGARSASQVVSNWQSTQWTPTPHERSNVGDAVAQLLNVEAARPVEID